MLAQNSRAGNPKRCDLNCQSRADCFINATPLRRPEAVVWAPLVSRPADYLPSGTVGYLQWWTVQKGGDPRTDHAIRCSQLQCRKENSLKDERTEFEKGIESMESGLPLTLFPRRKLANNKVYRDWSDVGRQVVSLRDGVKVLRGVVLTTRKSSGACRTSNTSGLQRGL